MSTDAITAFRAEIDGIETADDAPTVKLKSRDFFWFSPILKAQLEDKRADLVVLPRNRDELVRIAAAAARHRVALTVRGGGTGNYGQAVPLAGGVIIDMAGLDRVVKIGNGTGRFEAGARMLDIDKALRPERWELRYYPSTRKQATIGGFVAGGSAGAGSCTWGQMADKGAVIGVQVLTVEETPRFIELPGREALKVMHAYGVNGIITEVEMPLAPLHPWAERIIAFPTLVEAARFGYDLTAAEGIAKKLVSIFDGRIPPLIKRLAPLVPDGNAIAIIMINEAQLAAFDEMVGDYGGTTVFARSAEEAELAAFEGKGAIAPLYEYTWNHTTLHALRVEPNITYLQIRFPEKREMEAVAAMQAKFGEEMLLHLEIQRRFGRVFVSSLPLVRFTSPERLKALIAEVEELGGAVSDAHSYVLDNAGWKRTEAPQPEFKSLADPYGLMNPGKLKAWPPAVQAVAAE